MKRVIIVPILDVHRFCGFEEGCRDQRLAALIGDSTSDRSRERSSSEEMFLETVARGDPDDTRLKASKRLRRLRRIRLKY